MKSKTKVYLEIRAVVEVPIETAEGVSEIESEAAGWDNNMVFAPGVTIQEGGWNVAGVMKPWPDY